MGCVKFSKAHHESLAPAPCLRDDPENRPETSSETSTLMLEHLDDVPWADLEHAYGTAEDVPDLLRGLLSPDPKTRKQVIHSLYGNVFHQGTRYPATPHVVPFLIELCAGPQVPDRAELLNFWGCLVTGYLSVQERPVWGDGERLYFDGKPCEIEESDPYSEALHQIYRASLAGHDLLIRLLDDDDSGVRAGAAWVLACLPTKAGTSLPALEARLRAEPSGWVRAALAFALGELGDSDSLRLMIQQETFPAALCMAACELARVDPTDDLIETLRPFVDEPIEGYQNVPGAGGQSSGDAAFAVSHLPDRVRESAIPTLCDRLDNARGFDTMPLVESLLSIAFPPRHIPVTELTDVQRQVLTRMVNTEELWSIGNLYGAFASHGLEKDREKCAGLVGARVATDEALSELRSALYFSDMGFLEKARDGILKALDLDPSVIERAPAPDETWLLLAKAFADSDPVRALSAYHNALAHNPEITHRIQPTWPLADLLHKHGLL